MTTQERFWSKVVPGPNGCLDWIASKDTGGYGHLRHDGRIVPAHRLAFIWKFGPVPDGKQLDHLCRRRHCVNPDHLEAVSQRENILRGVGMGAINNLKTHCINGHAFTPENTAPRKGGRYCRACGRDSTLRYLARKKAVYV